MRELIEAMRENLEGNYKLSSTQLYVPNQIATEVLKLTVSIADEDLYTEEEGMGRELEVHITIKYGLTTDNVDEVKELLKQTIGDEPMDVPAEIEVKLGEVSLFESDKPFDVVKVDVESEDLHKLHEMFGELDNKDSHPEYKPHCTIAYVKKGTGKKYVGKQSFSGKEFKVNRFYFCSLTGDKFKIEL